MDACYISEGEWEDKAPASVKAAKKQIAKCLLYFLKDVNEEFAYYSWKEGAKSKFDKGAFFFFKILKDIIKIEDKISEKIEKPFEDEMVEDIIDEDLENVKTLRDYLEMKE